MTTPREAHANPLQTMLKPNSVAVIGATEEPGHPAAVLLRNLLASKFIGPIIPVHDTLDEVFDLPVYRSIDTLPLTPDLAVICSDPESIPDYVLDLGRRGVSGAVIMSRGIEALPGDVQIMLKDAALSAARKHFMRLMGPGSLGFITPSTGINASLAHSDAAPGKIAFITQSDALFTTVLDWANSRSIGFSHFISLGDQLDVNFGALLDLLSTDPGTRAILLYVESIRDARTFMSAARATARNKPVLVIKAGATAEGARGIRLPPGQALGLDAVYDAAFRRAGMLRVFDIDSMFDSVQTIARTRPLRGERLCILTNGAGPGLLAMDFLVQEGGTPSHLAEPTRQALAGLIKELPTDNPVCLPADAPGAHYAEAMKILLKDDHVDALLVMHAPSAMADNLEVARAVAGVAKKAKRNVFVSWLGGNTAEPARQLFGQEDVPIYWTADKAVRSFMHLVRYRRNQEMLMETPASLPSEFAPDTTTARLIVDNVVAGGRRHLSVPEAMDILTAYQIPAAETRVAATTKGAVSQAASLGFPVAVKILSPDVVRKTQAGGVALDLDSEDAVHEAAEAVVNRVREFHPEAHIAGFVVQKMSRRPGAFELFIRVGADPVFGPYIRFGQASARSGAEVDTAVSLPPLSMSLAKELLSRTRIYAKMAGLEGAPAVDLAALCLTLVKVSQLIIDVPGIRRLEINPLFADHTGVVALDADIEAAEYKGAGAQRLAIRPYPQELEECVVLKNGRKTVLRPIRPEDEPAHWEFISRLSLDDMRFRFFGMVRELPRSEMVRLTQIDYDREMAFIATSPDAVTGRAETLGVVRAMTRPDNRSAEFAIIIRSDLKGLGLGRLLMEKIIRYVKSRSTKYLLGEAMLENSAMAGLAEAVGFKVKKNTADDIYEFKLLLNPD
ncbi:MAG: acetate--CoA ligase family protein [Thermodesulfobacteriota bacterium]